MTPLNAQFTNNRTPSWTYDPEGRVLQDLLRQFTYDAAGQGTSINEAPRRPGRPPLSTVFVFDGDGNRVKTVSNGTVSYELRSTVLGGRSITDLNAQGEKTTGYVYADGGLIAKQLVQGSTKTIVWILNSPDGTGQWECGPVGVPSRSLELDPYGADVGADNPYLSGDGVGDYPSHGDLADFDAGCTLDGGAISCGIIAKWFSRNRADILNHLYRPPLGQTPSTFPTNQITFANILKAALEGTPAGDFLYPKADWRFINPTFPWGSLYANPQNPGRVPLEGDALNEYTEARNDLLELLNDPNSDCAKFLQKELGISGSRIAGTVLAQRPFDGPRSTLTMARAGLLPYGHEKGDMRVSKYFDSGIPSAAQAHYAPMRGSAVTQHDVYYLGDIFLPQEILHEALHTFLGSKSPDWEGNKAKMSALSAGGCNQLGRAYKKK